MAKKINSPKGKYVAIERICDSCKNVRRVCGQAVTQFECKICGDNCVWGNTCVPKLCDKCGEKHNICQRCGKYLGDEDSTAWCPDCGDEIFVVDKKLKPNESWKYYCIGCDKYFKLKEVD